MAKPIFNSYIAKQLLSRNNVIVDLQPDKKRENAVIFYFEETEKLINDLNEIVLNNINENTKKGQINNGRRIYAGAKDKDRVDA